MADRNNNRRSLPVAISADKDAFPCNAVYHSVISANTLRDYTDSAMNPLRSPEMRQPPEFFNGRGVFGETILHWAAILDQPQLIQSLIEHGSDPALTDDLGRTAADYARAMHHHQVLSLLERTVPNRPARER